ncbi:hypothetical protein GCM10022247_43120 [Allokutzneria multivorans]|uniref:V8-like Glu-specific endopeptidase n=1 Tax=Allokutzneria multivorans TaxID=1142134 RepID=A0ABP7SRL9_9PSEU
MKLNRLFVALGASAAVLALAPVGQAAPSPDVVERSQAPTAEVDAYWTPERIAEAVANPMPMPTPDGAPAAPQAGARDLIQKVPGPYSSEKLRSMGRLLFTTGGRNSSCSATSVEAANKNLVWTAAHCVHYGGVAAENITFLPGFLNNEKPYGTWPAKKTFIPQGWISSSGNDFSLDYAGFSVESQGGKSLTDTVGAKGVVFDDKKSQKTDMYGYPAESPYTGQEMYTCSGISATVQTFDAKIACNGIGGQSGGAWLNSSDKVWAVNSRSDRRTVTYGTLFDSKAKQLYDQAGA